MEEESQLSQRLQVLIGCAMDRMESVLADQDQFNRHFVKVKSDGDADQEERVYRKVDTKALREFVSGLKELKSLLREELEPSGDIRVIFEAGEEAFNE